MMRRLDLKRRYFFKNLSKKSDSLILIVNYSVQKNPDLSFKQLNRLSLERIGRSTEFSKAADLLDLPVLLGLKNT
jgi:hypothetical protein